MAKTYCSSYIMVYCPPISIAAGPKIVSLIQSKLSLFGLSLRKLQTLQHTHLLTLLEKSATSELETHVILQPVQELILIGEMLNRPRLGLVRWAMATRQCLHVCYSKA